MAGRFFFHIDSKDSVYYRLDRVRISALYSLFLTSLPGGFFGISVNFAIGNTVSAILIIVLQLSLLAAVVVFWVSRNLWWSELLTSIGLFLIMANTVYTLGGSKGMGVFYFIGAYSILYLFLNYRNGVVLPLLFSAGLIVRVSSGNFHPDSIYNDPLVVQEFLYIVVLSALMSIAGSLTLQSLFRHLGQTAFKDKISGLPNRFLLEEYINDAAFDFCLNKKPSALIAVKLMDFSKINSLIGAQRGDKILIELASRLSGFAGPGEKIGRWSGSVFMILSPKNDPGELKEVADHLKDVLGKPIKTGSELVELPLLIVISRISESCQNPEDLIDRMLVLLELNKNQKNTIILSEES